MLTQELICVGGSCSLFSQMEEEWNKSNVHKKYKHMGFCLSFLTQKDGLFFLVLSVCSHTKTMELH
jgi:hypothetical protein